MSIGKAVALAFALTVLAAPAASANVLDFRPPGRDVMTFSYSIGDLSAVVHAPRTLVGTRPVVLMHGHDALGEELARDGVIAVSVSTPASMDRHLAVLRDLDEGRGPLYERWPGFRGHLDLTSTGTHQPIG